MVQVADSPKGSEEDTESAPLWGEMRGRQAGGITHSVVPIGVALGALLAGPP